MREGVLNLLGIAHPQVRFVPIASYDVGNRCAEITAPDDRYLHELLRLSERLNKLHIVHTNPLYR